MSLNSIPIRTIMAHYNSIPTLLEFIKTVKGKKAEKCLEKWNNFRGNEYDIPDHCELLFGFVAYIQTLSTNLKEDNNSRSIDFFAEAKKFCIANNTGLPKEKFSERIIFPQEHDVH